MEHNKRQLFNYMKDIYIFIVGGSTDDHLFNRTRTLLTWSEIEESCFLCQADFKPRSGLNLTKFCYVCDF